MASKQPRNVLPRVFTGSKRALLTTAENDSPFCLDLRNFSYASSSKVIVLVGMTEIGMNRELNQFENKPDALLVPRPHT